MAPGVWRVASLHHVHEDQHARAQVFLQMYAMGIISADIDTLQ